jgi:penicillin-binding protein 1A
MRDQGYIKADEYQAAIAEPIELEGLKPPSTRAPYFVEWVKENLVKEYGQREVYRGGLRVKTTLDSTAQRAAEKAIKEVLDQKGDPSAALVAIRPSTGEVIAMVGGRNFKKQQYNVAVQGKRQPGSAFKPFVLVTALSEGVSPEKAFEAGPRAFKVGNQTWRVTGAGGGRKGLIRLREATEKSVNSVYAQLILDVGPEYVVKTA